LTQMENGIPIYELTTPHLADACLRLGVPLRCAPHSMRPAAPGMKASGRACPVRHVGSVDVFFEALDKSGAGDILVVDNDGRLDEGAIGDLIAREVKGAGLAGIVIWGLHRDSSEVSEISLPLFSLGVIAAGPQRLDQRPSDVFDAARVGPHLVTGSDIVVADGDGVLFLPRERAPEIIATAKAIRGGERRQALMMIDGRSLRQQLLFEDYMSRRCQDPQYSFRKHLRNIGGAIEE
jgi:4-hydroxy-4-methyl-2-oxoglutarate aldolase